MAEITPLFAASLADDIYVLSRYPDIKRATTYLQKEYGEVLTINNNDLIKGKTGGPGPIKSRTAFGFTLQGKTNIKTRHLLFFVVLNIWLTG